jgi:hypothetical protein
MVVSSSDIHRYNIVALCGIIRNFVLEKTELFQKIYLQPETELVYLSFYSVFRPFDFLVCQLGNLPFPMAHSSLHDHYGGIHRYGI